MEARRLHLPWTSWAEKPGRSVSTRKPRTRAVFSVFATFGPDDGHVGDGAGGDPHLFAVEDVLIAGLAGGGGHPAGIGSEAGLGEAEAAEFFAGGEGREPGVLLLLGAEGVDGVHDQRGLHADKAAQAGVAAFQLLHHQAVLDVGHAGAAVALEVGAEEAQFAHEGNKFARKAALAETLLDDGDEIVFDEVAGRAADEELVFREAGIEVKEVEALEFESHDCTCRSVGKLETDEGSRWRDGSATRSLTT